MGFSYSQPIYPPAIGDAPVDSRYLAHWAFNGNGVDDVGGFNVSNPITARTTPGASQRRHLLSTNAGWSASGAGALRIFTAITVGAWYYQLELPPSNMSVVGYRSTGGGSGFNFPWELGVTTAGEIRFFWQSGSKVTVPIVGPVLPFGEWFYVIGTRDGPGVAGRVYVNGERVAELGGIAQASGGGSHSTIRFMNNGAGSEVNGGVCSAFVLNTEIDDGQARELYRQAVSNTQLEAI